MNPIRVQFPKSKLRAARDLAILLTANYPGTYLFVTWYINREELWVQDKCTEEYMLEKYVEDIYKGGAAYISTQPLTAAVRNHRFKRNLKSRRKKWIKRNE